MHFVSDHAAVAVVVSVICITFSCISVILRQYAQSLRGQPFAYDAWFLVAALVRSSHPHPEVHSPNTVTGGICWSCWSHYLWRSSRRSWLACDEAPWSCWTEISKGVIASHALLPHRLTQCSGCLRRPNALGRRYHPRARIAASILSPTLPNPFLSAGQQHHDRNMRFMVDLKLRCNVVDLQMVSYISDEHQLSHVSTFECGYQHGTGPGDAMPSTRHNPHLACQHAKKDYPRRHFRGRHPLHHR